MVDKYLVYLESWKITLKFPFKTILFYFLLLFFLHSWKVIHVYNEIWWYPYPISHLQLLLYPPQHVSLPTLCYLCLLLLETHEVQLLLPICLWVWITHQSTGKPSESDDSPLPSSSICKGLKTVQEIGEPFVVNVLGTFGVCNYYCNESSAYLPFSWLPIVFLSVLPCILGGLCCGAYPELEV